MLKVSSQQEAKKKDTETSRKVENDTERRKDMEAIFPPLITLSWVVFSLILFLPATTGGEVLFNW